MRIRRTTDLIWACTVAPKSATKFSMQSVAFGWGATVGERAWPAVSSIPSEETFFSATSSPRTSLPSQAPRLMALPSQGTTPAGKISLWSRLEFVKFGKTKSLVTLIYKNLIRLVSDFDVSEIALLFLFDKQFFNFSVLFLDLRSFLLYFFLTTALFVWCMLCWTTLINAKMHWVGIK